MQRSHTRIQASRLTLAPLAVAAVLVACGPSPSGDGPLNQGFDEGIVCVPVGEIGRATIGIDVIQNGGDQLVELESVDLIDSYNLALVEAKALDIGNNNTSLVGIYNAFPPPASSLPGSTDWEEAEDFATTRVEANGGALNLVAGVELLQGAEQGTSAGLSVVYSYAGETYTYATPTEIRVQRAPCD